MEAAHAGTAVKEVQKSAVFGAGAEEALHHDAVSTHPIPDTM